MDKTEALKIQKIVELINELHESTIFEVELVHLCDWEVKITTNNSAYKNEMMMLIMCIEGISVRHHLGFESVQLF